MTKKTIGLLKWAAVLLVAAVIIVDAIYDRIKYIDTYGPRAILYDAEGELHRIVKTPFWGGNPVEAAAAEARAKSIPFLWLFNVTDADLEPIKDLTQLQTLHLSGTQITDAGLVYLKDLKGLQTLDLGETRIAADAGLVHLKDLKGLRELNLWETGITDAGLAHLKDSCESLTLILLGSLTPDWSTSRT